MTKDVHSHVFSENSNFGKKISRNMDLTRIFMALIARLVMFCNETGHGIEDLAFGAPYLEDNAIKGKIFFIKRSPNAESQITTKGDFETYAAQKNMKMAQALKKNPTIEYFFKKVVEVVDNHCRWVGIPFSKFKTSSAFIDAQLNLVLRLER